MRTGLIEMRVELYEDVPEAAALDLHSEGPDLMCLEGIYLFSI